MQADVDPALPRFTRCHALALDVMLAEQARVLSGQEPWLKRACCFWVKPGSVRKPNLPGLSTAKFTRMVRFPTAPGYCLNQDSLNL